MHNIGIYMNLILGFSNLKKIVKNQSKLIVIPITNVKLWEIKHRLRTKNFIKKMFSIL
jgi:hypothetical protein